jgi:hypothetical protein
LRFNHPSFHEATWECDCELDSGAIVCTRAMNSFSSLELIRAHQWTGAFFTTYALSLSFFEAVVLDALVRQGVERILIMADVTGVSAAVSEEGVRSAGRAYQVEPVAVSGGCFHPKMLVLTSSTEAHLVISSGNLTFGGWGSNLECVEHLHAGVSAAAVNDTAEFLELLATADTVRHNASEQCSEVAGILRKFSSQGTQPGGTRLVHNLLRPIFDQLEELAADLGGAQKLTLVSPFYDGGTAANTLCTRLGLDRVFVHAHHAGIVPGSFGSNWPNTVGVAIEPVEVEPLSTESRPLHAKIIEVVCRKGRIVLSGSANSTMAGLDRKRNVELCVARIHHDPSTAWRYSPSSAPLQVGPQTNTTGADQVVGVLRAVFADGQIQGEILTNFPPGVAEAGIHTGLKPVALGETDVSTRADFKLVAPGVELEFWKAQRLILRLESGAGEVAQGFVAFPSFGYISQRAGAMKSQFFALLTATDTPDDVAAIISYFLDNPADRYPEHAVGGNRAQATGILNEAVLVADLLAPTTADLRGSSARGSGDSERVWRKFLQSIFACFRESRGPVGIDRALADRDTESEGDLENRVEPPPDNSGWPIHLLENLVGAMLADSAPASSSSAFWMTHFVCDRIAPDPERIGKCLDKIVLSFTTHRASGRDLTAISGAVLVLACASLDDGPWAPLSIRRTLRRLGADLSQSAPDLKLIPGLVRVLAPDIDASAIWARAQAVTTIEEEITAFRVAGKPVPLDNRFPRLCKVSELENLADGRRDLLIVVPHLVTVCPYCYVALPTADVSRLRERSVVTHERCGRIILNEEV